MYIAVADYGIAMIAQLVNEFSNHSKLFKYPMYLSDSCDPHNL